MIQDDLYTIFSEYGRVKKAWLQRYHANGTASSNPPHNHRGFGFLIFYDGSSVEQLLGESFSRFIVMKDGRKLEVKRAVKGNDMLVNSTESARAPTRNVQQQQPTTGVAWDRPQVQAQQPPWQHDPRVAQWLPQVVSQQNTMMMAPTPWSNGFDGGTPVVMSHAQQPAYPPVQALQLAGSANSRPQAMLLPSNNTMQMPPNGGLSSGGAMQMPPSGGFGKVQQQQQHQGLPLTSGPVPGMMATMPNNTMRP